MAGDGWVVVAVYEADSGAGGEVADVLSYLGVAMPWAEATGRHAGPGRFFVRPDADGAQALDDYAGTLNDGSGLAYEVVGSASGGEGPTAGDVRGGEEPALRCPSCGASDGFTAHESYVHKLALDGNGDAWDDDLGAGGYGERISTRCDSCGHEWPEQTAEGAVDERLPGGPGTVGAKGESGAEGLEALEYAAHKAAEDDLVYETADDYWVGGEGKRAISGVLEGIRLLEGRASRDSGNAQPEPEGESQEPVRIFVGLDTFSQDPNDPLGSIVVFPLCYPEVLSDALDADEPEKEIRDDQEMMRYAEGSYDFWSIRIFGADGSYRVLPEDTGGA